MRKRFMLMIFLEFGPAPELCMNRLSLMSRRGIFIGAPITTFLSERVATTQLWVFRRVTEMT